MRRDKERHKAGDTIKKLSVKSAEKRRVYGCYGQVGTYTRKKRLDLTLNPAGPRKISDEENDKLPTVTEGVLWEM